MSWRWASASTPSASTSLERGLSSDPKSSVSPGSRPFRRKPCPCVTLNGFENAPDLLMSSLISMVHGASHPRYGTPRPPQFLAARIAELSQGVHRVVVQE